MSSLDLDDETPEVCGAGVWLLAATRPDLADEHRAYRTHCQAAPGHAGDHMVRVAGEPDDAATPVQPVTLTWPTTAPRHGGKAPT